MLGLPADPGRTGYVLLAAGVLLGLAVASLAWRRLRAEFAERSERSVAGIVTIALASSLAVLPFTSWRIAEDIRYTTALSRREAEGSGALVNRLEPSVFAALRARIPMRDTYTVRTSSSIESGPRDAFLDWIPAALLPRLPAADPRRARWIVSWGRRPGGDVTEVRVVHGPYDGFPATYLARAARDR